jgi:multiple RNA-binding domain-containing protein 1
VTFVRLPTKTRGGKGNEHRGFAFVQFATKATARRAFDALVHSTHLYGRRLVLEWADEAGDGAESLEQARTRVARRHAAVNEAERRPHAKRHLNETLHKLDMKKQKMRDEN